MWLLRLNSRSAIINGGFRVVNAWHRLLQEIAGSGADRHAVERHLPASPTCGNANMIYVTGQEVIPWFTPSSLSSPAWRRPRLHRRPRLAKRWPASRCRAHPSPAQGRFPPEASRHPTTSPSPIYPPSAGSPRSEEHTSELQSLRHLV